MKGFTTEHLYFFNWTSSEWRGISRNYSLGSEFYVQILFSIYYILGHNKYIITFELR